MSIQRARPTASIAIAALSLLMLGGAAEAAQKENPLGLPSTGDFVKVPLGDLAGGAQSNVATGITNPSEADVNAGRQLYVHLNCADCHGFTAKGGMGPDLTDKYWRYGGTPAAIYKSIYEGRPKGMPAWGASLSPNDIWQLVAYIQSLGGSYPADFYHPSLQGDQPGELVAPELNLEQSLNGSPPYHVPSGAQSSARPEGERIYVDQGCAVCHGLIGHGGVGPALAGDKFLAMGNYVAGQILLGRGQMPGFSGKLTDSEIAAVASYVRNSWGNHFGDVSPEDVQEASSKTQQSH